MKQTHILRVVSQDGKFSIRKCLLDEDEEIVSVSREAFSFKEADMPSMSETLAEMQAAMKQPILQLPTAQGGGWVDEDMFLQEFLESNEE